MHGSVSAGFDRMSRARTLAAVAICLGSTLPAAMAQPGPLTEDAAVARAMGSGVHSYFGGDYQRAYEDLTEAIAAGSGDPRALYFRGLAARRMGRIDEAEADFSQAATLEASGLGAWPVSRTLERVQGADRLALERHRIRSRIAALQGRREAVERRYSQIESAQESFLRRTRPKSELRDPAAEFERNAPVELVPPGAAEEPEGDEESEPAMTDEPAEREPPAEADDPAEADAPAEAEEVRAEADDAPMAEEEGADEPAGDAEEKLADEPMAEEDSPAPGASGEEVFGN